MAGVAYIDQAVLEAEFGQEQVRALFCDDGSGTPNATRLERCCRIASREADTELLKGWGLEAIATLVFEDDAAKTAVCKLAMAAGALGKPEWMGPNSPYAGFRDEAFKTLNAIAKANKRSAGESKAGANPHLRGATAAPQSPQFMFAPTRGRPRPGGY